MNKKNEVTFSQFLSYFEEVPLPVLLSENTIDKISELTKPLPQIFIDNFISRWETNIDEFTEIIPCFSIPQSEQYRAIVYWKASLLRYEYIIVTIDNSDTMIAKKTICGTIIDGEVIKKSVAKIDEDLIIHIQAGAVYDHQDYNPDNSQSYTIEILESGDMLFHIDENNHL